MASKVFALVTEAYGGLGGIAQYNRNFIRVIAGAPDVQSIFVLPRLAAASLGPMPAGVVQGEPILGRGRYAFRAFRDAFSQRPNWLFCGHLYMSPLAYRLSRLLHVPYIAQLHGTEIWPRPTPAQTIALEGAALILCVSRDTRRRVLTHTRVDPNRVVVLPNTFGSHYNPGDRERARAELGLRDEFALLTVGRLDCREGYKGHDRVIQAIARLPAGVRPPIYLIAGEGDDRARLEALAERLGVASRVRFLGFTAREALPDLYRAADLFVLPSTGEGFGIVFLEAMASGTPALGLSVGGAPDPLDFEPWGKAVSDAEFDHALRLALSRSRHDPAAMRAAVSARFGQDVFSRHAIALIDRMSGRR